jgi:hypothetical protein
MPSKTKTPQERGEGMPLVRDFDHQIRLKADKKIEVTTVNGMGFSSPKEPE